MRVVAHVVCMLLVVGSAGCLAPREQPRDQLDVLIDDPGRGTLGASCRSDGTCDEGLLCEGVTCVSQEGGACTADDECTSALSCKAEGCFASFQGAGRVEVELTWDTPGGDVDLRLNRGGDRYGDCRAHLCYFANCGNDADDFPEWDGDSGRTTGDPVMVLDDLSGFGPERIVVDTPVEGTYWVGADFYSGSTPTAVTVNVLVDGASVAQRTATLENGQWWTAFSFDVVGDAISVSEGGGVVDADDVPAWACK